MTRVVIGRTDEEALGKLAGRDPQELRARGVLIGTPPAIVEGLSALAEAGAQRLMAQWLDQDDVDGLELLAAEVFPKL
jgi:hypothetical protein